MSKPSSSFVSNVLKLASGSVLAQGLAILVAPILTRLFAPEAFGVAALFTSLIGVVGVLACLRYEFSIMLPRTDEEAANLLGISVCSVLLVSGVTLLVILLTGDFISTSLNTPKLGNYLWMVPIAILLKGLFSAFNSWNSRTKQFGQLSAARVLRSAVQHTVNLGVGFAGFVSGGVLIASTLLGQLTSILFLGRKIWHNDHALLLGNVHWKGMLSGLKRHRKFPIYATWSALLNTTSRELPTLFLAFFFSPQVVGFFALGRQVLNLPMIFVGQAIGQVFFQAASEANSRTQDVSSVVEGVFNRLVSFSLFPFLMLSLIGKDIFIVAFGAPWAEAGVYLQILAIWIFFQFIYSPISTLFFVFEKQASALFFNCILLVTRAVALVIGGMSGDIRFTLILYTSTGVICYAFFCFWLNYLAAVPMLNILSIIIQYASYSMPPLIILALIKWSFKINEMGVCFVALPCTIFYYFLIIRKDKELKEQIRILFVRFGFGR
jgi:O-antigen/teichoic acid export membrane protein